MQNMRGKRLSGEYQKAVYEIISTKLKYKTSEVKGLVSVTKGGRFARFEERKNLYQRVREEPRGRSGDFCRDPETRGLYPPRTGAGDDHAYGPELHFFVDDSMEYGDKIDRIIKGIHDTEPKNDDVT